MTGGSGGGAGGAKISIMTGGLGRGCATIIVLSVAVVSKEGFLSGEVSVCGGDGCASPEKQGKTQSQANIGKQAQHGLGL